MEKNINKDTDKLKDEETNNLESDDKYMYEVRSAVSWNDISNMIDIVSLIVTTTVTVLNFAVHLLVASLFFFVKYYHACDSINNIVEYTCTVYTAAKLFA